MIELTADQIAMLEAIARKERNLNPCKTKDLPRGADNGDTHRAALHLRDRGYIRITGAVAYEEVGYRYQLTLAGWELAGGAPLWITA